MNVKTLQRLICALAIMGIAAPAAAQALDPSPPATPVKLIFIHHSTGEYWLRDSWGELGLALRDNSYFVSDTNYGWGPDAIGDTTDIGHWWTWFSGPNRDTYMAAVYDESDQHSLGYSRLEQDPGGENRIIMFKSCYPNSDMEGDPGEPIPPIDENPLRGQPFNTPYFTISNSKGIYIELLNYFAQRPDKLFVVITAPPLRAGDTIPDFAANARAFNNWLVEEWLLDYSLDNVFVFDFYNVLTSNGGATRIDDPDTNDLGWSDGNHHRWEGGEIQHMQTVDHNYLAYWTGSSHPTAAGDRKATGEFIDLLNIAYHCWNGDGGCPGDQIEDADNDGVPDGSDNCPYISNEDQADYDSDGIGDRCETGAALADADGSSHVDGFDLARLARAFSAACAEQRYEPTVDFTRDCMIDGDDLAILTTEFGRSVSN